jgi:hypothetical protein
VAGPERVRPARVGERVIGRVRGGRPVVFRVTPRIEDLGGVVIEREAVNAFLAAAGQPGHTGKPAVRAVRAQESGKVRAGNEFPYHERLQRLRTTDHSAE